MVLWLSTYNYSHMMLCTYLCLAYLLSKVWYKVLFNQKFNNQHGNKVICHPALSSAWMDLSLESTIWVETAIITAQPRLSKLQACQCRPLNNHYVLAMNSLGLPCGRSGIGSVCLFCCLAGSWLARVSICLRQTDTQECKHWLSCNGEASTAKKTMSVSGKLLGFQSTIYVCLRNDSREEALVTAV